MFCAELNMWLTNICISNVHVSTAWIFESCSTSQGYMQIINLMKRWKDDEHVRTGPAVGSFVWCVSSWDGVDWLERFILNSVRLHFKDSHRGWAVIQTVGLWHFWSLTAITAQVLLLLIMTKITVKLHLMLPADF